MLQQVQIFKFHWWLCWAGATDANSSNFFGNNLLVLTQQVRLVQISWVLLVMKKEMLISQISWVKCWL
jgi:hypothetical protein